MLALVADDDAPIRNLLRRCLESRGFAVEIFGDAQSLLEASRRLKPALVISDIEMPGKLNGLGACRILRAEMPRTPVILITGNSAAAERIPPSEFDLVLVKPFLIEALEKAVARKLKASP